MANPMQKYHRTVSDFIYIALLGFEGKLQEASVKMLWSYYNQNKRPESESN